MPFDSKLVPQTAFGRRRDRISTSVEFLVQRSLGGKLAWDEFTLENASLNGIRNSSLAKEDREAEVWESKQNSLRSEPKANLISAPSTFH